ncbi:MAG: thiolase family protein [Verrucomicrobiales bacterium]|nr:thiolase family protein [Verrucomicrobiales bacterium]
MNLQDTNRSKKSLVIVDGVRTPFLKMGTDLASLDATEQGKVVVQTLLGRVGIDPALIDETVFGCVSQPADAANIARVIALRAGIPESVPAVTVHRNCGSGLEALTVAAERIAAGRGEIFIVGGTENMSRIPLFFSAVAAAKFNALSRMKSAGGRVAAALKFNPSDFAPVIGLKLGLTDPVSGMNMGETAELLARDFEISRDDQDYFALESHRKAAAAREHFKEEICPVYLPGGTFAEADNGIREAQSMEALGKLNPVFERGTGTVTAGNSSQITDGAVAMLVMTEERAEKLGLTPLGRLVDFAYSGCDPKRMGLGPAFAIRNLHERTGLRPHDAAVVEVNEAFAAQVIAVEKLLKTPAFDGLELPQGRLNPNGGAIALGHPVGATGARLVLTTLLELKRRKEKSGLVSLCIGGGQGAAAWLETL